MVERVPPMDLSAAPEIGRRSFVLPEPDAAQVPNLLNLLTERWRVLGALMMRETITRYGRENIGFLWLVFEPIIFSLGVVALWSLWRRGGHFDVPVAPFVLTGYMPLVMWRNCSSRALSAIESNLGLLYHRQINLIDIVATRLALEVSGTSAAFVLAYLFLMLLGLADVPHTWAPILLGWGLIALFATGLSFVVASLGALSPLVDKFFPAVQYMMLPVSGVFYMVHWLPESYRKFTLYMPTVSGHELIRSAVFGPSVPVYHDVPYVIFVCTVMIVIGLALLLRVRSTMTFE